MRKKMMAAALAAAAVMGAASSASALVNGVIVITVDENGHGTLDGFLGSQAMAFGLQNDPGPGGLASVLTYDMSNPPGLVAGDVFLQDGPSGPIFDVVRFNPNETGPGGGLGSLLFYSDNVPSFDSLADTSGPPSANYPNVITLQEVGPEGHNGAVYTPTAGQPGFVAGAGAPVRYDFVSDGLAGGVPEPAPWAIMLVGFGGLGAALRKRAQSRAVAA